ncbi:MAG: DUF393 domain-containing protein [Reichenbachiella sp.]
MDSDREIAQLDRVVLFDGVCMFCNTSVDFVLQNEVNKELRFTPLQSKTGKALLRKYEYPMDYLGSILYLENGLMQNKSNAAIAISKYLKSPFNWLGFLKIVPRSVRDIFYDVIAKRRYQWFGKFDACMIPTPELRNRFLE